MIFKKDEMKRILVSLSGITWLLSDILWYWGFVIGAFAINCLTLLFMAAYFINYNLLSTVNKRVVTVLNMWVWLSMCSLVKDVFKLENYQWIDIVAILISTLMVVYCISMVFTSKQDLKEMLSNLRRL
jgi:hypothetical protein